MAPIWGQMPASRARSTPGSASRSKAERRRPSRLTSRPWRPASVGVSDSDRSSRGGVRERRGLGREGLPARGADTTQGDAERGQPLVGVVGAQAQAVLGARGEHAVGLGDPAGDEVVDHDAEIAVGARDDEGPARAAGQQARR